MRKPLLLALLFPPAAGQDQCDAHGAGRQGNAAEPLYLDLWLWRRLDTTGE